MKDLPTPEEIREQRMKFMMADPDPVADREAILMLFKLAERFAERLAERTENP